MAFNVDALLSLISTAIQVVEKTKTWVCQSSNWCRHWKEVTEANL